MSDEIEEKFGPPQSLKLAVILTATISFLESIFHREPVGLGNFIVAAVVVIFILCPTLIPLWFGKNWARILNIVLNWTGLLTSPFYLLQGGLLFRGLVGIDIGVMIYALLVLNRPEIRAYCKPGKSTLSGCLFTALAIIVVFAAIIAGGIAALIQHIEKTSGQSVLWAENLETGEAQPLPTLTGAFAPSISNDGKKILYIQRLKNLPPHLYNFDATSGQSEEITGLEPAWTLASWCGENRVVYLTGEKTKRDIWIYSLIEKKSRRLTSDSVSRGNISCSPDGKNVLFTQKDSSGHEQIFIILADGSEKKQLTHEKGVLEVPSYPAWAPGSETVLYFGFLKLAAVNLEGSEVFNIALTGLNNFSDPRVFPKDSEWIFFRARPADDLSMKMNLYLVSIKTRAIKVLASKHTLAETGYVFSPDGGTLYYSKPQANK